MARELLEQLQAALGTSYSLRRELGSGGMSRVFLAHDSALDRDVVVKVLHPELAGAVNVNRFRREIQFAAQLQHPHIVPLLSAGELGDLPYLIMPFVAGRSLRERLGESPMLPVDEALDLLRDVARALAFAHGRGVIHRDIKPDNILLAEGSATVTDFGVAKALAAACIPQRTGVDKLGGLEQGTLTEAGTSLGTPTYMAPEQAAGDPNTDHRADMYAWGVMAYEMFAGRPPFTAKTTHKLFLAHISDPPEPITNHRPDCPPPLASLVMRCLAKDPEDRPQSGAELLRGLADVSVPSSGGVAMPEPASGATGRTLAKALGLYAAAFATVAAVAQAAVRALGLPDWAFPGVLIVLALGLPAVLFTAFVYHASRVARSVATLTPGGSPTAGSTMVRLAAEARPHVTWRRTALGGVIAVSSFAAVVISFMVLRTLGIGPAGSLLAKGVLSDRDQIVVGDFTAPPGDSGLGVVVAEAVRMGLMESGVVKVMQPTQVAAALTRMQRPGTSRLDRALSQEIAIREGTKAVVDGNITPLGAGFVVTVRLRGADPPDELASYRETAVTASDLVPAIDRATRKLRGKIGESLKAVRATVPLERATTGSLPALRKYTAGFRKNAIERDFPGAITLLEEAIALDSNFALAYRQASIAYTNAGIRPGRADTLLARAYQLRNRLPDLERALVEATFHAGAAHHDRVKAVAALERALEIDSTNASALNLLGLLVSSKREYARAESLFKRGMAAHPEMAFFWSNVISDLVAQGKLDEAQHVAEEYVRRFPGNPTAGMSVWASRGRLDSVDAQCRRATEASVARIRVGGFECLATVALTRGRLREHDRLVAHARAEEAGRGAIVSIAEAVLLDSAYQNIWFRERMAEGVRQLDALLAHRMSPALDLIGLYTDAGRPDKARAELARYDSAIARDTVRVRREGDLHHRALGEIATAERRYDVAIREWHAADTLYDGAPTSCAACVLPALARAYDLAGKPEDAIAYFERYLRDTPLRNRDLDAQYLAGSYKRLGELYEAKGDRDKAASYYTRFIDLWKEADPELQPKVTEARRRLAALTTRER
jgi:tetratricopeptide (TPR) repeat protein/tRNA A-37 threonylcarbamoyl transferase component Bud32